MAANVTLKQLRDDIRSLADQPEDADPFETNQELNRMINRSLKRWYTEVARAVPERFETIQSLTADANLAASVTNIAGGYSLLPTDFMTHLYVDRAEGNGQFCTLQMLMPAERNQYASDGGGKALAYRLVVNRIYFNPTPTTGTYVHRYVPAFQDLVNDTDTVDGINGWEQWVVYDVVLQSFIKEESSVEAIRAERDMLWQEIQHAIELRSHGAITRISSTRNKDPFNTNCTWGRNRW